MRLDKDSLIIVLENLDRNDGGILCGRDVITSSGDTIRIIRKNQGPTYSWFCLEDSESIPASFTSATDCVDNICSSYTLSSIFDVNFDEVCSSSEVDIPEVTYAEMFPLEDVVSQFESLDDSEEVSGFFVGFNVGSDFVSDVVLLKSKEGDQQYCECGNCDEPGTYYSWFWGDIASSDCDMSEYHYTNARDCMNDLMTYFSLEETTSFSLSSVSPFIEA